MFFRYYNVSFSETLSYNRMDMLENALYVVEAITSHFVQHRLWCSNVIVNKIIFVVLIFFCI